MDSWRVQKVIKVSPESRRKFTEPCVFIDVWSCTYLAADLIRNDLVSRERMFVCSQLFGSTMDDKSDFTGIPPLSPFETSLGRWIAGTSVTLSEWEFWEKFFSKEISRKSRSTLRYNGIPLARVSFEKMKFREDLVWM